MTTTDKWAMFQAMTDGWIASADEIWAFARDMVSAQFIDSAEGLLDYFEKPWHWEREHAWWVANGRPDSWAVWDKGVDSKFEVDA